MYFHNQGPIDPQHSPMTHPEVLQVLSSCFTSIPDCAAQPLLSARCLLFFPCADCLLCVWYPVSTAPSTYTLLLMILLRAARQLVAIVQFQTTPIYQTFFHFSIQGLQLHISSFCDIGNLIRPKPMSPELPWVLHELVFIY